MNELSWAGVSRIFLWMYGTVVVPIWAMVSFVPMFGLLIPDASIAEKLVDLAFLSTGFVAAAGLYGVAVISANPGQSKKVFAFLRGRIGLVTAYATVWLVGYWLLKGFVV